MDIQVNKFYQNLGKLFYAVAASDSVVRKDEFEALKKVVSTHWLSVDDVKDEFGEEAPYQIEIVFDFLHASKFEDHAHDFVKDFGEFKSANQELFSAKVDRTIWRTCISIADAFYGKNQKEKEILAVIKTILLQD